MLRRVLAIGLGDLRLALKERSALFWMLVMPVAFVGLFGKMMGGGDETTRRTALTVLDQDHSFLSKSLLENLRVEGLALRIVEGGAADTIAERVRTLTIPRGFSDSLAAGDRVGLSYETESGRSAERDMAAEVEIRKAIGRLLATLAEMDTTGEEDRRLPLESAGFQATYRSLSERPDLIRTVVTTAGRGRPVPSGFAASAPAMVVLFMLMNTVIYGAVLLTQEKQNRCLARLAGMPLTRFGILSGKLLGRLLIAMLQSAILIVLARLLYHVYWGPSPAGLACLLVSLGLACASLGMLLGAVLNTQEQASAVGWIIPLFLGAIGGCWWPLEVVPSWMRAFGHVSPAAWAMDGLHGLISFGRGGEVVLLPSLVLLGYAAIMMAIAARTLRME